MTESVKKNFFFNKGIINWINLLVILTSLFYIQEGHAQQDSLSIDEPQIVVMARPQKDGKIMLRWAVTSAMAWRKLNTYGYQVKRYTITRNNATLSEPVEKSLGLFKPKPLQEWLPLIEISDNAAVLAQSIYGDNFDMEGMAALSTIVNLAEEQEQRFTWGLYAADQDFNAAQTAGLGFMDHEVNANEKYVYKITSKVPDSILAIQEGGIFIGLKDYEELPKPLDLAGVFFDGKTMLSWNYATHNKIYNSYFIERSEDGIHFRPLNKLPLTSLNNSERTDPLRMFYTDSITNGRTYYYRIKGKTPFGEISPVSDVVSGRGEKQLPYVPHITTRYFLDDKSVLLEWKFLEEGNSLITGFELNQSDEVDGTYKTVVKDIPPEARKINYDSLMPTNYMTITALGKNGSKRTSFPALVQPVDSVPPSRPVGFKGIIDSLGVVTLSWEKNIEEDMLGYRVFKGNNKNEEYSQITISPHQGNMYYDSVSVKNLNPKVYYQLVAVDQRFNMSEPSEILEVKKPDFIKPTQPVFKSYKIKDGKVHLTWAKSSSEDVVIHEVYRKAQDSTLWALVHTVLKSKEPINQELSMVKNIAFAEWADEKIKSDQQYSYTIIAIDDSGLESDPAPPLTIIVPKTSLYPSIKGLYGSVDKEKGAVEILWKPYKLTGSTHIAIYKGVKGGAKSLLREIPMGARGIVDRNVKANNTYEYLFRVVFKDGSTSETVMLKVKY